MLKNPHFPDHLTSTRPRLDGAAVCSDPFRRSAMTASTLWRRLDRPGHEAGHLDATDAGRWLSGTAVFQWDGRTCDLAYRVRCDADWQTTVATVTGRVDAEPVNLTIAADADRRWSLNDVPCPALEGCTDVDLGFSPSTNLLPVRRLALAIGESADVRAAWLRFPELTLEPLPQVYRRMGERTYRYESGGGTFARTLTVDEAGFVTLYPGLWEAER